MTIWSKDERCWTYISRDADDNIADATIVKDPYLSLDKTEGPTTAIYRLSVDGRRSYQILEGYGWILLIFGKPSSPRKELKGVTLWSDRNVGVIRYGRDPRSYLVVAKKERKM